MAERGRLRYRVVFTRRARKDFRRIAKSKYATRAEELLRVIEKDPFQSPPPYESLGGNLAGQISRRISLRHRLVYIVRQGQVEADGKKYAGVIEVTEMWGHYAGLHILNFV